MSAVSYLGSKISLISKSEIRYEGILYTIDTKESTVALANVRICGTEERPAERLVPPREEVYEYIIFRASDIKDLRVCEPAKPHAVLAPGIPLDPAIVQVLHSAPQTCSAPYSQQTFGHICGLPAYQHYPSQMTFQHVPPLFTASNTGSRSGSSSQISLRNKSQTIDAGVQVSSGFVEREEQSMRGSMAGSGMKTNESQSEFGDQRRNQMRPQFQRGRGGRRGRGRRSGNFGNRSPERMKFDGEYDFEQANEEFKQLETKLASIKIDDPGTETVGSGDTDDVAYDRQKSFFDNISCEASRLAKGIPRFNWRIERKLNVETFGVAASNLWMRRRRGRGGFRRGFPRGNAVAASTDAPKTVTFGANKVVVVENIESVDNVEVPSEVEVKEEEIPTVEIVVEKEDKEKEKEKEWQDANEDWN